MCRRSVPSVCVFRNLERRAEGGAGEQGWVGRDWMRCRNELLFFPVRSGSLFLYIYLNPQPPPPRNDFCDLGARGRGGVNPVVHVSVFLNDRMGETSSFLSICVFKISSEEQGWEGERLSTSFFRFLEGRRGLKEYKVPGKGGDGMMI